MKSLSERLMSKISVKEAMDVDVLTSRIKKVFPKATNARRAAEILVKWGKEENITLTTNDADLAEDILFWADGGDSGDSEVRELFKVLGEK